ncbi:hypothetical protein AB0N24_22625 [Arthrobacter sp. NPDC093128]|uniref:hypothetical protein n=1 Tax=Arthrobacter sp. NPDC093128 TaxID=3154979 RepID=UPI00343D1DAC
MMSRTKTGMMSMVAAAVLAVGLAPGAAVAHEGSGGGSGHNGSDKSDDWKKNSEQRRLVKTLRDVTDDYRWLDNAIADGYEKASECVEIPGAAMGFHYLKKELLDDKTQARKPEVLVYMPNERGRMKLVAIEYMSTATERPEIAGLKFEDGPFPGTFALHAWVWRDNPDGMFAAYNPDLSCPK